MRRRGLARLGLVGAAGVAALLTGTPAASAHPLGNFTVNHYDGLLLSSSTITDAAVVDYAEIPTRQARAAVDTNADGQVTAAERAAWAATTCVDVAKAATITVAGHAVPFRVTASAMEYRPGAAALDTTRLTCSLSADVRLDRRSTVAFADTYDSDRIGWHEITARTGDGVRLRNSPVPADSITNELRHYPNDLLSSPLKVTTASLDVLPGGGESTFVKSLDGVPGAGPVTRALETVSRAVDDTVGGDHVTLTAGLLAVLLSVMLGAGHAMLPGHGKTVMAAYIAGRRGSMRDAVTVGATVTLTHTAGVLALGLLLTVSASVAGEAVTGWLGVLSGLLVAGIGVGLLVAAARGRQIDGGHAHGPGTHTHGPGGHSHSPAEDRHAEDGHLRHAHDGHAHDHGGHGPDQHGDGRQPPGHDHAVDRVPVQAMVSDPGGLAQTTVVLPDTAALPAHAEHANVSHALAEPAHAEPAHAEPADHGHDHAGFREPRLGRGGLVGMGIAGGLVPSPSAVVVLLGAVALGRTVFGVLLVLAYGLGMAGTLTAAGLALVRVRGRIDTGRFATAVRLQAALPFVTASLVLVVGLVLAARGYLAI